MTHARVVIRAGEYRGVRGFHVIGSGGIFAPRVFCMTREGADLIKAAFKEHRAAYDELEAHGDLQGLDRGAAIAAARQRRADADVVVSSVLLSRL